MRPVEIRGFARRTPPDGFFLASLLVGSLVAAIAIAAATLVGACA